LIGVVVAVISSNATIGSDLGHSTVGTERRLGSHRSYVRAKMTRIPPLQQFSECLPHWKKMK
jgi:hypothetical protein